MSGEDDDEEEYEPGKITEKAVAGVAVRLLKRLTIMAVDNIAYTIYRPDGSVRAGMDEAHEWLRGHVMNYDNITNFDIANAVEAMDPKWYNYSYIMEEVDAIQNRWVKGGVKSLIGLGKRYINGNPDFVKELQRKGDRLILIFLQGDPNPKIVEAYMLLKDRPKCRKYVLDSIMLTLGIPPAPVTVKSVEADKLPG